MRKSIILFLAVILANSLQSQETLLVPEQYASIQSALDAAEENTSILVSPGTYFENLVWPGDIDGISLLSTDGSEATIIDGSGEGRVVTIVGFSSSSPLSSETTLRGFTLQNGYLSNDEGAGLLVSRALPSLSDLIIQNNHIVDGGEGAGAQIVGFSGSITNCSFNNNTISGGLRGAGGGLSLAVSISASIVNCTFDSNVLSSTSFAEGAGLYMVPASNSLYEADLEITNCRFANNYIDSDASPNGAGVFIQDYNGIVRMIVDSSTFENNTINPNNITTKGGGIYFRGWSLDIANSKFNNNKAHRGAGVHMDNIWTDSQSQTIMVDNSEFSYNDGFVYSTTPGNGVALDFAYNGVDITMRNCIIAHNKNGSSIFGFVSYDSYFSNFYNCTIAYNDGPLSLDEADVTLVNSVLWNPAAPEEMVSNESNPVVVNNITANDCIIRGGFLGNGIIDDDPLFIDENLLIPSSTSPCLARGSLSEFPATDILGNPRPAPAGSPPDIGAYEVDQHFAHVRVQFFYDVNENGMKDGDENFLSTGSVIVQENEIVNNFRPEGLFIIADQGPLNINYSDSANQGWSVTSQESFSFVVDSGDFSESIAFGLHPEEESSVIETFLDHQNFRCGEEVQFSISAQNLGNTIESGTLWLNLDERLEHYVFDIEPDVRLNDYVVGWNFENLYPFNEFEVTFTVTAPLIEDESQVGELYTFKTSLDNDNSRPANCYEVELRCAFDPNDKKVNPNRPDSLALLDDYLHYTVRFQNTGNDYAKNVVLRDTLDENLDLRTFSVIGTSHPDILDVILDGGNAVTFQFNDIYLPDSLTNLEGSNGHVSYIIRTLPGIPENTQISNTAHIYFDFNPAIVTNTVNTVMVEEFPISSAEEISVSQFELFPNPTTSIVHFSEEIKRGFLLDAQGKRVMDFGNVNTINVGHLVDGLYTVVIASGDNLVYKKLAVAR